MINRAKDKVCISRCKNLHTTSDLKFFQLRETLCIEKWNGKDRDGEDTIFIERSPPLFRFIAL